MANWLLLSDLLQTMSPVRVAQSDGQQRENANSVQDTMSKPAISAESNAPLQNLEEWEDFLKERYPEPASGSTAFKATDPEKKKEQFRNYEAEARPSVREFYRLNHCYQTRDFVQEKRKEFLSLSRRKMGIWEAMEFLN